MPVFSDYREVLVCEADGNPRPEVIWIFNNKSSKGANLTISTEMAGLITCSARNIHGNVSKTVELVPTGKKNISYSVNVVLNAVAAYRCH